MSQPVFPREAAHPVCQRPARRRVALMASALAWMLAAGCGDDGPPPLPALEIQLQPSGDSTGVELSGLSAAELEPLREAELGDDAWSELLRVTVVPPGDGSEDIGDLPPVLGSYEIAEERIRFTPMFPFDPGREYAVTFDPSHLPGREPAPDAQTPIVEVVSLPRPAVEPTTVVERIYPSGDRIPENQLRLYLHFSAPMSDVDGLEYLSLRDARGRPVEDPFLPLGLEFWDPDHRRYTVFFDPGRIKQGLGANEQLGRALDAGETYTLVVDPAWPDAEGNPLQAPFEKPFTIGPADMTPLDIDTWRLRVPSAGSTQRLVVSFPEPLDHALMLRTIGVEFEDGESIRGRVETGNWETRWMLTPNAPWQAGRYALVASTVLEDLAGNRMGEPFEIDLLERVEEAAAEEDADGEEPARADVVRLEFDVR